MYLTIPKLRLRDWVDRLVDVGHGDVLLCELALALVALGLAVLALEDRLAVLVKLQLGDHALGGVDANLHRRAAGLLAGDALDVDDPLLAVALDHLALAALIRAAHHPC